MADSIPVYKIGINEEDERTGVKVVSFVSSPAIEEGFIALSKAKEKEFVALADDVKQVITGPALIPDIEILRISEEGEAYKIVFTKEAIESINRKFFKEGNIYDTNFEHAEAIDGNYITESWIIKNSDVDKARALGMDLPEGTWMLSYHIPDKATYNALKEMATGFSIEGRFILDEMLNKNNNKEMKNSNLFDKVMAAIKPLFFAEDEAGEATTEVKAGENLSVAFKAQIQAWAENAGLSFEDAEAQAIAESGLDAETARAIISGATVCPGAEDVTALAGAIPGADVNALQEAWLADGCGEEEETEEAKKETPAAEVAEVAQEEEKVEAAEETVEEVAKENAELKALNENIAQLSAQVEELKAALVNKNTEIAELKKEPAGSPVVTTPGAEEKATAEQLKNLPFHARYIANLKKNK